MQRRSFVALVGSAALGQPVPEPELDWHDARKFTVEGLDLYAKDDAGRWRWLGIGRPTRVPDNVDTLVAVIPATPREYMIYLPLRNGVASLEIGVTRGSPITAAPARPTGRKSIAFYATSITHGISASRPGITHPARLQRDENHLALLPDPQAIGWCPNDLSR